MPTDEEIKKAQEEEDKKFQARVNERVAREAESIRRDVEARFKGEIETLRATNRVLEDAQKKINDERSAALKDEIVELREGVDPALQELFDDLPAEMSDMAKRDWLKKQAVKMPVQQSGRFPRTPKPGTKGIPPFEPFEKIDKVF